MDVIHEEGDFECNTGMDGKPVQLFQCRAVGVMWSLEPRSFIRRAAVCSTEDKGCSVDEDRPERTELQTLWKHSFDRFAC